MAPPLGSFTAGIASASQICDLIDRVPLIDALSTEGTIPSAPLRGEVEIKDVTFCYPTRPESKVCDGFNLKAEAGQVVAICGSSGSGMSVCVCVRISYVVILSVNLQGKALRRRCSCASTTPSRARSCWTEWTLSRSTLAGCAVK